MERSQQTTSTPPPLTFVLRVLLKLEEKDDKDARVETGPAESGSPRLSLCRVPSLSRRNQEEDLLQAVPCADRVHRSDRALQGRRRRKPAGRREGNGTGRRADAKGHGDRAGDRPPRRFPGQARGPFR